MKRAILLSLIAAPFIMVGCGGGSSSSSTATSAKITGTVPGTLIEAFCDNNYYASVTSTQNGTNEHPFEIEVPTNTNCRLVMTTNENDPLNRIITPIGFTDGNTIVISQDINLGNIPLEVNYQNADDKDGDHVVDTPLTVNPNGATTNNSVVHDNNANGIVDNYDDDDDDNIVNAYEDDDKDGIENIHDDEDGNGRPDFDDEDHNGNNNSNDDSSHDENDSNDNANDDSNHDENDSNDGDSSHDENDSNDDGDSSHDENDSNDDDSSDDH